MTKKKLNILFCSEGFKIDGVASYNLYLSDSLRRAGHNVVIAGRWMGRKGFQNRHYKSDVRVIQHPSLDAASKKLVDRSKNEHPDILITDSRRAFPFSQEVKKKTGSKVITIFHDPPQLDRKGERSIDALLKGSDAWITAETSIYDELKKIHRGVPLHLIQRPITGMFHPEPQPKKDPFNVLCLGRLSKWKSPGLFHIVDNALELKKAIPSLQIIFVGGGGRQLKFWWAAKKANFSAKESFVHIAGSQKDPQPWIHRANIVCAGATSAIEALLCDRPVIAFSGFWIGRITEQNLDYGVSTHFGERAGDFYIRENPGVVTDALIQMYQNWDDHNISTQAEILRKKVIPDFDFEVVNRKFQVIFNALV